MLWPFIPDRSGYTVESLDKTIVVKTAGGFPRERVDLLDATFLVSCSFTFSSQIKYNEFQALWAEYKLAPQWFDIMLITDITDPNQILINHKAQVIPQSFRLKTFHGRKWEVSMQLEAYPDGNP